MVMALGLTIMSLDLVSCFYFEAGYIGLALLSIFGFTSHLQKAVIHKYRGDKNSKDKTQTVMVRLRRLV